MKRHLLTILIIFNLTTVVTGQEHDVVKGMRQILHQKNFPYLQAKIKTTNGAYWETLREILPGVQEGVLQFGYIIRDTVNPSAGTHFTFRVNLLTKGDRIFYYELNAEKYRKQDESFERYLAPLDSLRDLPEYDSMMMNFSRFYGQPLLESDLFQTEIVYGNSCGYAGTSPSQRETIDTLVKNRDQATLLKWLRSANTEKQFYAVDGVYQLKKAGIPIKEKDMQLIRFVLSKKGVIQVCSGCIFSSQEISEMADRLQFR